MPPNLNPFTDELNEVASAIDTNSNTNKKVPNVFPKITNVPYRLAIIGEAPGADEIDAGVPFIGASGRELDRFLSRFNILRDACFIGNICQQRPVGNKIASLDWDGPEIQFGLTQLKNDLASFKPHCILLLGGSALHTFRNPDIIPKKRKDKDGLKFVYPDSISDWRGSFFLSHNLSPLPNTKCIASFHPAACMRQYSFTPYLMMDIKRAFDESTFSELTPIVEDYDVALDFHRICHNLDTCYANDTLVGTDIEGYWNNWKCISFSNQPNRAFIVPFCDMDGKSLWTLDEETTLFEKVTRILSSPKITKVWQNGLYDRFVLQYGHSIIVRGPSHDIMLKHWELYCELEKSLGVQCSIYTKKPFYKQDIKSQDRETYWRYCCRDSAVTLEIDQKLDKYLNEASRKHYEFNLVLLNALLYMELRGIKYNHKLARERLNEVNDHIYTLQHDLDKLAGFGLTTTDKTVLRAIVRDSMCFKRDATKIKSGCEETYQWAMRVLLGEGELTKPQLGRLGIELDLSLNIKGGKLKPFLYSTLKLPEQKDPQTGAVTTDYEALITLKKKVMDKPDVFDVRALKALQLIIDIGELRTRSQMLTITTDPDGRVRGSYNLVGSETGRVTCQTSPTGSGYALQTIPNENELKPIGHPLHDGMRDLLLADDGCYLAKADLKGSDGWTIGANLAALGDDTMLKDLQFGLKPAYFLTWTLRHGYADIPGKTREQLKEMFKEIKKEDWDYFAGKQCIWGYCYLMGAEKSAKHVFNVSEGAVYLNEQQANVFKSSCFRRYSPEKWHNATQFKLNKQPYPPKLISPSGHTRMFWGRKQEILGEALANEPQEVTTYATNRAMYNLWTDPENRVGRQAANSGSVNNDAQNSFQEVSSKDSCLLPQMRYVPTRLRIEPMHQVHDEMLSQFKISDTSWAVAKIKQYFDNEMSIAGIKVTIPFDGAYGTEWSMSEQGKKGSIS